MAVAGFATAAEVDLTKLPPPSDQPGLTYETNIRPLLEASCVRCLCESIRDLIGRV